MNKAKAGTALITGASSGIGATYADRLARRGYDLILVARNEERLNAVASQLRQETGVGIEILRADLTKRDELALVEQRLRDDTAITVLVNNAGIAVAGEFVGNDIDALDAMVQLNVVAVMRLAAAVTPGFVKRGNGTLINIASVLALAPELFSGVYSGTKAFVLNLSQSLQKELHGKGVRVQAVLPGATITEIWDRSGAGISTIPAAMLMPVDAMVNAALAGLDMGEQITLPSLPDLDQWQAFQNARQVMGPNLSLNTPAERYSKRSNATA